MYRSFLHLCRADYGGLKWKASLIPIPEESKVESPPVTVMCVEFADISFSCRVIPCIGACLCMAT